VKVVTIENIKYEVLKKQILSEWSTKYFLKNLTNDEKFMLKIEDYREAEFVVNGKLSSVIHKIGNPFLKTVLHSENLEFKEEK
jgi:hypothetical protein